MSLGNDKSLVLSDDSSLVDISKAIPEYKPMIAEIQSFIPEIRRAKSLFGKTQSQFMDNMLTVSKPTPIRNLRQIMAEVNKIEEALVQAYNNNRKKEIEKKILLRNAEKASDSLDKELILVEADIKASEIESSKNYIAGSLRKLVNYKAQYHSICEEFGVSSFNEIDFEQEEERYHIMTAFEQGLNAARSRGGIIDEGNMIYFSQIGINGSVAQREVSKYLSAEAQIFAQEQEPAFEMQLKFLNCMAEKFKGCSFSLAKHKGMTTFTKSAALERGDTRLLNQGGE